MRVLMLGWEFPPLSSGGLGTACHGLVKALSKNGADITLVLPTYDADSGIPNLTVRPTDQIKNVTIKTIVSPLSPYMTSQEYTTRVRSGDKSKGIYGSNLFAEVARYSAAAEAIAMEEQFDLIHAHDWLTFKAGMRIKERTGKPLVVHVHATEFDRAGDHPNQHVYDVERAGMHAADQVIAVSDYTKQKITNHYGVHPAKVAVVHNAVEPRIAGAPMAVRPSDKVVLFLGRMTMQKGPDYFIHAAQMVSHHEPSAKFILAGTGDMEPYIIEKAVELGLSDKVLFTGFLSGGDIDRAYRMADLYVMPSVSEPFGITALEAMSNGTPVLMSKQSGASEVVSHALKADFWDVHDMAQKMLSVLRYKELKETLHEEASKEVKRFTWDESSRKVMGLYGKVAGW